VIDGKVVALAALRDDKNARDVHREV